jgi:hypothetical protein
MAACQPYPRPAVNGSFQTSAPRGGYGANGNPPLIHPSVTPGQVVQLGLRDKLGSSAQPLAVQAKVVAPNGTSTTAAGQLVADTELDVNFPGDFSGAPKVYPAGVYTVIWTQASDGGFMACDGFWAG